jgi:hypothetical protein
MQSFAMTAIKITQDIILLIATALLAFAASGENQSIFLFLGYLCVGMIAPVLLLHRGQMTASLVVWVVLMLLFAFIFDSDRMLNIDYRPTAIGQAMLWAVPIVAVVVRMSYWLIDRLRLRGPDGLPRQRNGRQGAAGAAGGTIGKANHPAYPWLIGCWLLWPTATAVIAMMDDNRWDRMRYNNSLLLLMFLPPIVVTIGFFAYRYWRDRKTEIDTPI